MSQKDTQRDKEAFMKELEKEANLTRTRVSGYSRRDRAELLKLARKMIDEGKIQRR